MAVTRSGRNTSGQPTSRRAHREARAAPQKTYKAGDECKRHRMPDNAEKNVQVTGYRRRK